MSAYIVETNEIATLAASIALVLSDGTSPQDLADMLHAENVASVNHRYNENTAPEVIAVGAARFNQARAWAMADQLAAVDCLVYQSCEHSGWPTSAACLLLKRYRLECIAPTSAHDLPHNPGALIGSPVTQGHRNGFIVCAYSWGEKSRTIGAGDMIENQNNYMSIVWLPKKEGETLIFSPSNARRDYVQWLEKAAQYKHDPLTPAQAERLHNKYRAEEEARQQVATIKRDDKEKARAIFEAEYHAKKPAWAKAAIVAELHANESDTQSDYWGHSTSRVIILAWSKHTRNNFAEFRKAAKNAPETLDLATADKAAEHRENYSMGGGYYLAHGWRHDSGWNISKTVFNDRCECNLPAGQWAIPDEKPAHKKAPPKPAPVIDQAAPMPAAVDTLAAVVRVNNEKKGYEIEFTEKPSASTRDKLKASGFRWSRKLGYWYAKQNDKTGALAWLLTPENSGPVLH